MGLSFERGFSPIELQFGKWTKDLDKQCGFIIREAAREFLRGILNAIHNAPHTTGGDSFPVQTGEAKASLRPLARILNKIGNAKGVSFNISPATGKSDRTSQGESKGSAAIRDDKTHPGTYIYSFTWSTDVYHYIVNEDSHSSIPKSDTPWKSVEEGERRAEDYIINGLTRLMPKVRDYITVGKGKTNGFK